MQYLFTTILLFITFTSFSRPVEPILVTDQTLQINGEQRFYFAFETGDEILIDLEIIKGGKTVKEFEVLAYPESSKYKGMEITSLKSKSIRVLERGVYEFRLKSGAAKNVRMRIMRVPQHEARTAFDTNIHWQTVTDTIRKHYNEKVKVTYDTAWVTKYQKVLKKIDTTFVELANRQERVHSRTNLTSDNVNVMTFNLPPTINQELLNEKVISWAYWIGVGDEGTENYNEELKQFLKKSAFKVMAQNLLVGLALGIYSVSVNPPKGDNIYYELSVDDGKEKVQIDKGDITSVFGRETKKLEGKLELKLDNDNFLNALNISVKVLAVAEKKVFEMQGYQERVITPIEIKDAKGRVIIRERQVPVINAW